MKEPILSKEQNKRAFFSGVLSLSVANIIVKVIGLLFKIPIANILSQESLGSGVGLGYFSASYTVYTWLFMVATAGLPNGISIVIAENRAAGRREETRRIFRSTLMIFLIVGFLLSAVMLFCSGGISALIKNPDARFSMIAIAPTLIFVCVMSVLRGYFYGFQEMLPSALSEVVEAVGKLLFGIGGAYYAYRMGYSAPRVAAYAVFGVTAGVFLGTLFLFASYLYYNRKNKFHIPEVASSSYHGGVLRRVFSLSIPITVASSVMSLTGLIDVGTMMARLQSIGYTESEASALYGTYTMLAVPIYNLPIVLLSPISAAILPLISGMLARSDASGARRISEGALRIVSLFVIPSALGIAAFSYPILSLFYEENAAAIAAPMLSVLAAGTFFLGLLTVMNSVLQAHKMAGKTVISMLAGAIVKLVFGVWLVGNPDIGMYGVPLSTVLCYFTIVLFDTYYFARYLHIIPHFSRAFIRPICASGLALLPVKFLLYPFLAAHLNGSVATVLSIAVVAASYLISLLLLRAVERSDIMLLPYGDRIYHFLLKRKLISKG